MDSLIEPEDLFVKAKEFNQPAVAVTDHGTLAGIWDSYKFSKKHGVKLIAGCEFYFVDNVEDENERLRHVILLAKNHTGYRNLLKLSELGFNNLIVYQKKVYPRIDWKMLEENYEGLICTTACGGGIISQLLNVRDFERAESQAKRLKAIFKENLAFELQPNALKRNVNLYGEYVDQKFTNRQLKKLAEKLDVKMIAATNAHYVTPDQHMAHDTMLSLSSSQPVTSGNRLKYNVNDFYIKNGNQVKDFFVRNYGEEFSQELVDNTLWFANKCEEPDWIDAEHVTGEKSRLPRFPVEDEEDYDDFIEWKKENNIPGLKDDALFYRYRSFKGMEERISSGEVPEEDREDFIERMNEEFEVFEYRNFSSYMLIVADFLSWCRKNDIKIGYGRGSVGGSSTAYANKIHEAYPKRYGLIFARFLNKFKNEFPDIDSDIEPTGREKLHNYLRDKYGAEKVAHVSNLMKLKPKVYVRAISKAFQLGGGRDEAIALGNDVAAIIPEEFSKVTSALEGAPLFSEYANRYPQFRDYAKDLQGKLTAWSTHAGGILVGDSKLSELFPLRKDKDGNIAVEFEKERTEENGLVKIDTLGLETLNIVSETKKIIKSLGKELKEFKVEGYDQKAYDLVSNGDTFCVFQLGTSAGTIDLCRKVKPKNMDDLSDITALARPSAKNIRVDFIKTKNEEMEVNIPEPFMERAYGKTLGFGLYEECLMFLAQDAAGWSLHEADRLRKLTKMKGKSPELVAEWKEDFIQGMMKKHGKTREYSEDFWENSIATFGGYAFNKSHAVLYSMLSYETAWLKAHYPLEFLVSNLKTEVLSGAKKSEDNVLKIKEEIRALDVKILPPDVNESDTVYKIVDDNTLLTSLDSIKYMGKDAMPEILEKRPFVSFEDFLTRCDGTKVKAPSVQALAACGALDSISGGMSRKQMYLYAADFKTKLRTFLKNKKKNPEKYQQFNYPWPDENEWSISEIYALENYYLGEGLSGNKFEVYNGFFKRQDTNFKELKRILPAPSYEMSEECRRKYTAKVENIKCEIKDLFDWKVKNEESKIFGERMGKFLIEDYAGNKIFMTCFPEKLDYIHKRTEEITNKNQKLEKGVAIKVCGTLQWYEGELALLFEEIRGVAAPPALPADLKAKKVSMRKTKKTKKINVEESDRNDWLEDIDDELSMTEFADIEE